MMRPDLASYKLNPSFAAFFRYRPVGDKIVISNYEGSYLILTHDEFKQFAEGTVAPDSALYRALDEKNFIRETYRVADAAAQLKARKHFIHTGPNLHVMVVTLRCNETCIYCHASRANMDAVHTDMSKETAEKSVDLALSSTSPFITIRSCGDW